MTQTTTTSTARTLSEAEIRNEIDDWYHVSTLCQFGPTYNRGVHSAVADAHLFAERGQLDAATHWLVVAAWRAGHLTEAEAVAQDPWGTR